MEIGIEERQLSEEELILKFLADHKWRDGYICRKCGHDNYCSGKKPYSRRCTRCKTDESATAHTLFHRCKLPIIEAFHIARMICCDPKISTYEISRQTDKRQMTCWKFKTKIIECMQDKAKLKMLQTMVQLPVE